MLYLKCKNTEYNKECIRNEKKLLLLIMLFIFPVMAGAEEYAIEYKVGDAVLVNIIEEKTQDCFM